MVPGGRLPGIHTWTTRVLGLQDQLRDPVGLYLPLLFRVSGKCRSPVGGHPLVHRSRVLLTRSSLCAFELHCTGIHSSPVQCEMQRSAAAWVFRVNASVPALTGTAAFCSVCLSSPCTFVLLRLRELFVRNTPAGRDLRVPLRLDVALTLLPTLSLSVGPDWTPSAYSDSLSLSLSQRTLGYHGQGCCSRCASAFSPPPTSTHPTRSPQPRHAANH